MKSKLEVAKKYGKMIGVLKEDVEFRKLNAALFLSFDMEYFK